MKSLMRLGSQVASPAGRWCSGVAAHGAPTLAGQQGGTQSENTWLLQVRPWPRSQTPIQTENQCQTACHGDQSAIRLVVLQVAVLPQPMIINSICPSAAQAKAAVMCPDTTIHTACVPYAL